MVVSLKYKGLSCPDKITIMAKRKGVRALYGCSQQSFYTVAAIVWANYNTNILKFTAFKAKYNPAYSVTALLALTAAKLLPNQETRNAMPESVRIALLPLGDKCLANQRKLKSYIEEAYPTTASTMLASAGNKSYKAASHEGWEEMNTMITDADLFIGNNTSTLEMAGTNMPTAFVATYTTDKTAFETQYKSYLLTSQATTGDTSDKMKANNKVYNTMMAMLKDGQLIFEADENRKAIFTFATVLGNVTGNGTTGMRTTVVDSISKVNIINFTVTVQPGATVAAADGIILELKMSEANYTVVISAPAYHDLIINQVQLKTGVMHRLDVELVKI